MLTDPSAPGTGCGITTVIKGCLEPIVTAPIDGAASSAFDSVCKDFATGATDMLGTFATAFSDLTRFTLDGSGIDGIYAISLTIGFFIATILLMTQAIRMVVTHQGRPMADAAVGLVKFTIAISATLAVTSVLLVLADQLTDYINLEAFGGQAAFAKKLSTIFAFDPQDSSVLLLIFGAIGILVVAVLWLEMLFRHAAVLVLVATSPIAAAGQIGGEGTSGWWRKFCSATVQLIILKPVIALVFAIGFTVAGDSTGLENLLTGMLILILAVVAWPAIASLFTFTETKAAAAGGIGAALGFVAGKAGSSGGGGSPQGVSGASLGQFMGDRTAANISGATAGSASAGGAAAGGAGGTAAAAGPAGLALAGAGKVAGAISGLADHASAMMQNTSAHGGLDNPTSAPATGSIGTSGGGGTPGGGIPGGSTQGGDASQSSYPSVPPLPAVPAPASGGSPPSAVPPPPAPVPPARPVSVPAARGYDTTS